MSRKEELTEGVTLYCGDMLEILPTLGEFDACVTDPPYGLDIAKSGRVGGGGKVGVTDYGASDWDHSPIGAEAINLIRGCSRWQIIFGGNYFELEPSPCWLVWDKRNTGHFADCELAWTNMRKPVRKIEWLWNGMIRKGSDQREHPTQKPVGVMEWCIEQLPVEVGSILDPYMGSGTTGVAAIKRGKAFYGIEREPKYFDIACRRISEALAKPDLFVAPPAAPKQEALL